MDAEDVLLQKCKLLIENRLEWDTSETWTNHDFHALSNKIQDTTGVNLSIATLKRIWGKVKYDSKPTITTLNTLAQFIGYENWRTFKQSQNAGRIPIDFNDIATVSAPLPTPSRHRVVSTRSFLRSGLIGTALCGGVILILAYGLRRDLQDPEDIEYQFSSKKVVSEGVPNSVIFDYDASAAPTDTIYIQQSWDETLRAKVDRNQHQHTSIYYTPGFFQAKLVVGKKIVKEHNLWITSQGWLALVKQETVPVYFKDADFRMQGMLSLPIGKLKAANIPFQPETPWTSYYNVRDFGNITTDNFVFETTVRNDYKDGTGVCQGIRILLLTEGNVIIVPLSIKGCVSELGLAFGAYVDGRKTDLSAFGADLSTWVNVRMEVKNKRGKITINEQVAYEGEFPSKEEIVGMIFRFQGTGSVDRVRLASGDNAAVFEDKF